MSRLRGQFGHKILHKSSLQFVPQKCDDEKINESQSINLNNELKEAKTNCLIPHLKQKSKRWSLKYNLMRHNRLNNLKELIDSPKIRSKTEFKRLKPLIVIEKKKKLRWYDIRPRIIINRYYRENFAVRSSGRSPIENHFRINDSFGKKNNITMVSKVFKRARISHC